MMAVPLFYIKDKQAFSKQSGSLRLIGKPIDLVKKLKDEGCNLVHIVDLDAKNGNQINFDIYDNLTYFIHIQIEGPEKQNLIERLLSINARVVVNLPSEINLKKFNEKKRLLVGKISSEEDASEDVFDLLYCGENAEYLARLLKSKRRIILYSLIKTTKTIEKKLFGIVKPI